MDGNRAVWERTKKSKLVSKPSPVFYRLTLRKGKLREV